MTFAVLINDLPKFQVHILVVNYLQKHSINKYYSLQQIAAACFVLLPKLTSDSSGVCSVTILCSVDKLPSLMP